MAFTKLTDYWYSCLSSDEKTTTGVYIGARLIEIDTDQEWIFDGSVWYEIERVMIAEDHKMIHLGRMYHADYRTDDGSPLADNAEFNLEVVVGAEITPHIVWNFYCEGLGQGYVFEGATQDSAGTEFTPINRNRNSSNVSGVTVYQGSTFTDDGTPIHDGDWIGGGGPGAGAAGESRAQQEIILQPSTTYLFRVTVRANNLRAGIELDWYE